MSTRCCRCNHWSCGVQTPGGECNICKELHELIQLLVSGGVSLTLEQAILAQLRGVSASVQALIHSSSGSASLVDSWLDKAPQPIKTSPAREVRARASSARTSLDLPLVIKPAASSPAPIVLAPRGSGVETTQAKVKAAPAPAAAAPAWEPTLRHLSRSVSRVAGKRGKSPSLSPPRSSRRLWELELQEAPIGLSPRDGDSESTEWSDDEVEPDLSPGTKLTRGLKRRIQLEIKLDRKLPEFCNTARGKSEKQALGFSQARQRSPKARFSPPPRRRESERKEWSNKDKRKDRRDSREYRRRHSHPRDREEGDRRTPAPGTGKHFGKNKGRKKRFGREGVHFPADPPDRDDAQKETGSKGKGQGKSQGSKTRSRE